VPFALCPSSTEPLKLLSLASHILISTGGFVEKQHEANTWAMSGKTTEGKAILNNFHKTAMMMLDKDFLYVTFHPCFMQLRSLVSVFDEILTKT
jgi:hypothetical protein